MITARMERDMVREARNASDVRQLNFRIYHLAKHIADAKERSLRAAMGIVPPLPPERLEEEASDQNRLARVLYACTSRALELTKKGGRRA